jgi:hypothetical protein
MHFNVSGVDVFPLIPPLVAFLISSVTTSAGVSGAFMLLPFQVSVLHFTSPAVSPTNLIYNIFAIPGGLYKYIRERRMAWAMAWVITAGTLPGVFAGAVVRIKYLPDPRAFKMFMGCVLLYLAWRLTSDVAGFNKKGHARNAEMAKKFNEQTRKVQAQQAGRLAAGLPADAVVKMKSISFSKIEYEFWGDVYAFNPVSLFVLSLAVGLVGGIYGIGGGAIIAPFCVAVFGLPVYIVAGAALAGTFVTSIAGVFYYHLLAHSAMAAQSAVAPDWLLGALFGAGGLAGTYFGASIQKYLPEKSIKAVLSALIIFLAVRYISQFFIA